MCHFVVIEVARGGKPFATNSALMGFFSTVDSSMGIQTGGSGKTLVTNITNMRTFSRMNANVSLE